MTEPAMELAEVVLVPVPDWILAAAARSVETDTAQAIVWAEPDEVDNRLSDHWCPDEVLIRKVHYEILGAFKAFGLLRESCSLVLSPRDWESLRLGGCTRLFGMPVSQWEGATKPLLEHDGTYYPSTRL